MLADRVSEELELFVEDAQEQLSYMEQAILDIQDNGIDDNYIGALFRAMHTIKGTAGMFGFDAVVEFTHIGENLLSDVREGKLKLTDPMLDTLLQVKDHTKILIDNAVEQKESVATTVDEGNRLIAILETFLASEQPVEFDIKDEVVQKEEIVDGGGQRH